MESFKLGDYQLVPNQNLIVGPGGQARVNPKTMDVLMLLFERCPEVVTTRELVERFWRADISSQNLLHKAINELRRALQDDPRRPRFIATVPKRGYRMLDIRAEGSEKVLSILPFALERSAAGEVATAAAIRQGLLVALVRIPDIQIVSAAPTDALPEGVQSIKALGSRLGATHLLTGTISAADEDRQLAIQLVRARDGTMLFAERCALPRSGVDTEIDSVVLRIARLCTVHLDEPRRARMLSMGTVNVDAFLAMEEAEAHYHRFSHDAVERTIVCLRRAIALDPKLMQAYEKLAATLSYVRWEDAHQIPKVLSELEALAVEVQTLAPNSETARLVAATRSFVGAQIAQQEAQLSAGFLAGRSDWELYMRYGRMLAGAQLPAEAAMYLERAQSLAPDRHVWLQHGAEVVLMRDGLEASLEHRQRYLAHDPADIGHLSAMVMGLAMLGREQQAQHYLGHMRRYDPVGNWSNTTEHYMLAALGRLDPNGPALERFLADRKSGSLARGEVLFILGDIEGGIAQWRGMRDNSRGLLYVHIPSMTHLFPDRVKQDPRYIRLLDEIGFGAAWQRFLAQRVIDLAPYTQLIPPGHTSN